MAIYAYALESVTWRRPGVLDVRISAIDDDLKAKATSSSAPSASTYFSSDSGAWQLVEHEVVDIEGAAKKHTWLFRKGKAFPGSWGGGGVSGGTQEYWSMDVALMQVPITSHPDLKKILDAGGGVLRQGEVEWPRYLNNAKNPWFGTSDFLVPSITMTLEKIKAGSGIANKLSFSEIDDLGYSDVAPDGGFAVSDAGDGRKPWVLESHRLHSTGNEFRETKVWRHGGVMGWLDMIYKKDYWSKAEE